MVRKNDFNEDVRACDPEGKMMQEIKLLELQPLVGPEHDSRHEVQHTPHEIFAYGYSGLKQVYWCEWMDWKSNHHLCGNLCPTFVVRADSFKQGSAMVVLDEIHKHDIVIPKDHMNKLFMDLPI